MQNSIIDIKPAGNPEVKYNSNMCYYISITPKPVDLEVHFSVIFQQSESFQPVYSASAFTYPDIPVISIEDRDHIQFYRWGLIPSWVKDLASANTIRKRTLNARAETIFEKPSFRHSIRSKRCLILADGFFEWRHEGKKAYPYHINLKDGSTFAIAGIWDTWTNPDTGEDLKTFSVITTAANSLLEKVHNTRKRMPVILSQEHEKRWLENNLEVEEICSMLTPYSTEKMNAYTVPNIINRLGYNTAVKDVLEKHRYLELPDL